MIKPAMVSDTWQLCSGLSAITLPGAVTCACLQPGGSLLRGESAQSRRAGLRATWRRLHRGEGAAGALCTLCPSELPEGRPLCAPVSQGPWKLLRREPTGPACDDLARCWVEPSVLPADTGRSRDPVQEQAPLAPVQGASGLPEAPGRLSHHPIIAAPSTGTPSEPPRSPFCRSCCVQDRENLGRVGMRSRFTKWLRKFIYINSELCSEPRPNCSPQTYLVNKLQWVQVGSDDGPSTSTCSGRVP